MLPLGKLGPTAIESAIERTHRACIKWYLAYKSMKNSKN